VGYRQRLHVHRNSGDLRTERDLRKKITTEGICAKSARTPASTATESVILTVGTLMGDRGSQALLPDRLRTDWPGHFDKEVGLLDAHSDEPKGGTFVDLS
jgi:hypothetical protein